MALLFSNECIYPTSLHKQNVTQGQFFKALFNRFEFSFLSPRLVSYPGQRDRLPYYFAHISRENSLIYSFTKSICAKWNAISLVRDLNSRRRVHFLRRYSLHQERLLPFGYVSNCYLSFFFFLHIFINFKLVCSLIGVIRVIKLICSLSQVIHANKLACSYDSRDQWD